MEKSAAKEPIDSSESTDMPWWTILLIALAIIAFIIIVVAIVARNLSKSIMLAFGSVISSFLDGLSTLFFFSQIFGR